MTEQTAPDQINQTWDGTQNANYSQLLDIDEEELSTSNQNLGEQQEDQSNKLQKYKIRKELHPPHDLHSYYSLSNKFRNSPTSDHLSPKASSSAKSRTPPPPVSNAMSKTQVRLKHDNKLGINYRGIRKFPSANRNQSDLQQSNLQTKQQKNNQQINKNAALTSHSMQTLLSQGSIKAQNNNSIQQQQQILSKSGRDSTNASLLINGVVQNPSSISSSHFKGNNNAKINTQLQNPMNQHQFYRKFQSYFESLKDFQNYKKNNNILMGGGGSIVVPSSSSTSNQNSNNDVTPRKIVASSSIGKKQIAGGFRGSSSRTFGSVTTATQFRGSSQSSINISGLHLGHNNRQSKIQNKSASNIAGDSIMSGLSINNNSKQARQNHGKRILTQNAKKQNKKTKPPINDLSPYVESKSITGRTSRSFVLDQPKQLIDQEDVEEDRKKEQPKPKSQLDLLIEQLMAQKQENLMILKESQVKAFQLKEQEVVKWSLREKSSSDMLSRTVQMFQKDVAKIKNSRQKFDTIQEENIAQNLLSKINNKILKQQPKQQIKNSKETSFNIQISQIQSSLFPLSSPQTIYTRLSNIPCLLQIKQPSKTNTRAVIVLSSSQSSTGFVIKYGANKITLSEQLNRLFFDSQRNQLILKRGQKFEQQLQNDGQIRRSVIVRLKGGALFPRSRILITIRSECANILNKNKYELKDYMQSKIKQILVQFREKRYMLNYTQLLFLRNSFYEELLNIRMKDFVTSLQNPIWSKLIKFLQNSAVITRAYICAMEQTTVLKPELRFFQNRFIGKNFNLYTNSDYDEEEIAQEVMAITGRRIEPTSRLIEKQQRKDDDYDDDDLQEQEIFKQKNLSKRLIAKEQKNYQKKKSQILIEQQIKKNGKKLLRLNEAVENQSDNNDDTNLCFESTNQFGQYFSKNQLIRIENGKEQQEQEQQKKKNKSSANRDELSEDDQSDEQSLKQFIPRGLQTRQSKKNFEDYDEDDDDDDDQIDLGTIQDNDQQLKPYISQSWGGIRGDRIFGGAGKRNYNQKTPMSQRYQNIQIDSTSSSVQLQRSSSQKRLYQVDNHRINVIQQQDKAYSPMKSRITPRMIAKRDTIVMDLQNQKIQQSSYEFNKVIKEGGKLLDDLALQALIHRDFSKQQVKNQLQATATQALAVNTARITHSQQSVKQNQEESEGINDEEQDFIASSQYQEDCEDEQLLQKVERQKLIKLKRQVQQQQRLKNKALRLQLEDAHNFQYVPNYTQKTNTIFPGTNRSQFTVIALQTPKCIPIQLLQQKNREDSSSKSPTVRQFFKPQTEKPDNPFLQFNFFYRYTSNAPRFTKGKKQQDDDQLDEVDNNNKQQLKTRQKVIKDSTKSPIAKIQRAQRRSSFSNQRILAIKNIRNFKIIALKIEGDQKQNNKIVILTDQNTKSQFEQQQLVQQIEEFVTRIDTEKIMNTIMTDQAINLGSPVGGQKINQKQSGQISKDDVLAIDANWLKSNNLKGYSSMKDVERKIQKFIELIDLKGMIHYHKPQQQQKQPHQRYHSNLGKNSKQRKLIST